MTDEILNQLALIIRERRKSSSEKSYTKTLLEAGVAKCAKKLGEEAVETVIAATSESNEALTNEAADLLYHLLVVLECRDVDLKDVLQVLDSRMGISGLEEKASRAKD
ncbi:MAG: phosphoribosyl-ATP diphosphatase [Methyloligellaceae bacterium]